LKNKDFLKELYSQENLAPLDNEVVESYASSSHQSSHKSSYSQNQNFIPASDVSSFKSDPAHPSSNNATQKKNNFTTRVHVLDNHEGDYYPATIMKQHSNGEFTIRWDDTNYGDERVVPSRISENEAKNEKLEPKAMAPKKPEKEQIIRKKDVHKIYEIVCVIYDIYSGGRNCSLAKWRIYCEPALTISNLDSLDPQTLSYCIDKSCACVNDICNPIDEFLGRMKQNSWESLQMCVLNYFLLKVPFKYARHTFARLRTFCGNYKQNDDDLHYEESSDPNLNAEQNINNSPIIEPMFGNPISKKRVLPIKAESPVEELRESGTGVEQQEMEDPFEKYRRKQAQKVQPKKKKLSLRPRKQRK